MLVLPIKKKWLGMVLSGEKGDEYREIKPYWTVRIVRWLGFPASETETVLELLRKQETIKAKPVVLQNGYGRNAPKVEVMCTLSIGNGKTDWGAEAGKEYYRFHIRDISGDCGVKGIREKKAEGIAQALKAAQKVAQEERRT